MCCLPSSDFRCDARNPTSQRPLGNTTTEGNAQLCPSVPVSLLTRVPRLIIRKVQFISANALECPEPSSSWFLGSFPVTNSRCERATSSRALYVPATALLNNRRSPAQLRTHCGTHCELAILFQWPGGHKQLLVTSVAHADATWQLAPKSVGEIVRRRNLVLAK